MHRFVIWVALAWAVPASANGRGVAVYRQHCARCHVVGQGTPVREKHKSFIDITLAAKQHDQKWLLAFLRKPYAVETQTACRANLDDKDAVDVYRFLLSRLSPPAAGPQSLPPGVTGVRPGQVPPPSPVRVAAPIEPPKPHGMVRR